MYEIENLHYITSLYQIDFKYINFLQIWISLSFEP